MEDVEVILVVALMALEDGQLTPVAIERIEQAKAEALKYDRPYLVLCGGYTGNDPALPAESAAAEDYLRQHGYDRLFRHVLRESSSRVTVENAPYAMRIIERCLPDARMRVIVGVSSSYHIRFFDQLRLNVNDNKRFLERETGFEPATSSLGN